MNGKGKMKHKGREGMETTGKDGKRGKRGRGEQDAHSNAIYRQSMVGRCNFAIASELWEMIRKVGRRSMGSGLRL